MGGQESKFIFRRGIFRLFEENEIPVDDEYWKQFWTLPKSAEDVFTFFSTQDILHIRNHATKNLRTLIYVVVSKLVFIKDEMDHPERKKEALNCLRIITRIMPFIYEKEETRAWEHGLFWNIRRRKKLYNLYKDTNSSSETSHIINDNMDFKAHLKYTQIIENEEYEREDYVNDTEYEILRPLAEEFLDALNDMFFFAGFTIPIKKAHEKVIYSVWEPGIGHACSIKATAEFDLNKIEILRCILSVVSRSLYFYSYNQEPNLYIIYLITNSNKKVVLNLLCSLINTVINYNPTKWQMFYNHMISLNYRQLLVSYCLRFLLILLDYQIPSLSYIQKDQSQDILVNKYSLYFGKLHRADDIKFLFSGIYKILSRFVQIGSFYFPVTEKSIKYCPEMIMLLWKAFQINHHFKNYLINTNNIMDYIVLLLCYSLEHKKETSHVGLIKICILILQSLSLEPSFYEKLNAGFEHYKILPVSIKTISIKDTYTDFIIISIYMLITTSKGVLNSLYSSMLSILVNIAPYTQNLSVLSCIKLMQLFHSFSSPSFLLANENNHTLLQYLLETFSGIIQYQMKKNLHLIYAILRSSEKFELLRDFTLENALLEVKRKQQLKKNESDNIKIEDTKMASKNDIHFSENTQMYNTFFEANNSNFSIDNDDMSDEINYSENTSIMDNSLTKNLHSSFVGTSSSGSDFLKMKPVVSEKVEKELLKQIDFSLQNKDVSSFEIYTSENMSEISKGFIPTNEWVESWHPYLKLDIILTVLKQLKPKIDNIAFSTSNPNVILEALSSLTVEFDITNPKRRYFVQDDQSINKIEGLLWGHIYVAETKFLTGAIGIWAGTSIKLLKIQELKDSALLLNPKNAIDLVTKTVIDKMSNLNFYNKK